MDGHIIDGEGLNVVLQKEDIYFSDSWVFWYDDSPPKGVSRVDYESAVKELGTFSTVQEFWRLWTNLKDVKSLPDYSNLRLFRKGVKPLWEDPANTNGGKWVVPAATVAEAERLWSVVIIAAIGEQFEDIKLTGIVLSLRPKENVLQLWTSAAIEDPLKQAVVRNDLHRKLDMRPDVDIIFQVHFTSLEFTRNFVKKPRKKKKGRKLAYDDGKDSPSSANGDESDPRDTPNMEESEEELPYFIPILEEDDPAVRNNNPRVSPLMHKSEISPRSHFNTSPTNYSPRNTDRGAERQSPVPSQFSPRNPLSTTTDRQSPVPQFARNPLSTTPPPKSSPLLSARPDSRGFNNNNNGNTTSSFTRSPSQEVLQQKYGTPPSPVRQTRARSHSFNAPPSVPVIPFNRPLTPQINPPNPPSPSHQLYHPPVPRSPPRSSPPATWQAQSSPNRPPSRLANKSPMPLQNNRPPSRQSPFPGSPSTYRPPSRSASTSPSLHNRQLHQSQVAELLRRVSKATEQPLDAYIDVKEDANAATLISQLVAVSLRKKRSTSLGLNAPTPTRSSPSASSPSSPLDSPNPPSSPRLTSHLIYSGTSAFSVKKTAADSSPPISPENIDRKIEPMFLDLNASVSTFLPIAFTNEAHDKSEPTPTSDSPAMIPPVKSPTLSPKVEIVKPSSRARNSSISKLRDSTIVPDDTCKGEEKSNIDGIASDKKAPSPDEQPTKPASSHTVDAPPTGLNSSDPVDGDKVTDVGMTRRVGKATQDGNTNPCQQPGERNA